MKWSSYFFKFCFRKRAHMLMFIRIHCQYCSS